MQYKERSIGTYLKNDVDIDDITYLAVLLSTRMKQFHERGYCINNISFNTVIFDEYDNITFSEFYKTNDPSDITKDIIDFNNFSIGLFVLLDSKKMGYYGDVSFFDYSLLAKQDSEFIKSHYQTIENSIPLDLKDYYDDFIINNKIHYLEDFVKAKQENGTNKGNSPSLVKATPVGKALSEKNEWAFANALVYPILSICAVIMIILIYLLCIYL